MGLVAILPLLTVLICTVVQGATIDQIVETYSGLVSSNFENLALLKGYTVDIFNPKVYKCDSQLMADHIAASIKNFFTFHDTGLYDLKRALPKEDLKRFMVQYPASFASLTFKDQLFVVEGQLEGDELIMTIEFLQHSLRRIPSKIYEIFLENPNCFRSTFKRNIWGTLSAEISWKPTGFLQVLLLVYDQVEEDFFDLLSSVLPEEVKLRQVDMEERWIIFFAKLEEDIPKKEQKVDSLSWSTLNLLMRDGYSGLLISKLLKYATENLKGAILKCTYEQGYSFSPPFISIDDLRPQVDYDSRSTSIIEVGNGVDMFSTIPSEVLNMIVVFCIQNDWLHTIIAVSRVCKRFHEFTSVSHLSNIYTILRYSEDAAKRLVNDANRHESFRLGYPWNVSNQADIFSLFAHAMTAHPKAWSIDELFDDLSKHFPGSNSLLKPLQRAYGRWDGIVGGILENHKFTDTNQYMLFAKRAISISIVHITFNINNHLDGFSVVKCLEEILEDGQVAPKLRFTAWTMSLILSALIIQNPKSLLFKMLNCETCGHDRFNLFQYLFIKHHFAPGNGFRNAFILLSNSFERDTNSDLNPDHDSTIRILVGYMEKFFTLPEGDAFKFLIDAILDGKYRLPSEKSALLLTIMEKFFNNRLPAEKLVKLLTITDPESAMLNNIYSAICRMTLQ